MQSRKEENCVRSEYLSEVWNFRNFWIWKVTCQFGENYGEVIYYRQKKEANAVVSKTNVKELWESGNLTKLYNIFTGPSYAT